uniref:Uncharacterized protein n=1 Tax=Meloidogyne enterolobii TaxID=390850 RepID=A0A6V7XK72_MELEN|nr:unnamed protein product [Meloidogyne enterolobii]
MPFFDFFQFPIILLFSLFYSNFCSFSKKTSILDMTIALHKSRNHVKPSHSSKTTSRHYKTDRLSNIFLISS